MSDEKHKPWCSEQARKINGGCICKAESSFAAPSGSVESAGGTQSWFRLATNPAPRGVCVLMWFIPSNGQPPWACVDRIENRVIQLPDFWAPIFPPNAALTDPADKVERNQKEQ